MKRWSPWLSTIRSADQILVLEHGQIVERGTRTELMAAEGRYSDLYNTQFAEPPVVGVSPTPRFSERAEVGQRY